MSHVTLRVIPVPGDGDCLYHAFIKGINLSISPQQLRGYVADKILNNKDLYDDLVTELVDFGRIKNVDLVTPEKLSNVIRHTKEWATSTVIHILAVAFNVRILVLQKINGRFFSEEFTSAWKIPSGHKIGKTQAKSIYLYRRGYHFELLQPLGFVNGKSDLDNVPPIPNTGSYFQRGGAADKTIHPVWYGIVLIALFGFSL